MYGTAIVVVVTNMHILNPGVFVSVGVTLVLIGSILAGYLLYDPIRFLIFVNYVEHFQTITRERVNSEFT